MRPLLTFFLFITFLTISTRTITAEPEKHDMKPYVGSADFERIKSLAGHWKGTHQMGEEVTDASVVYDVTSNQSAVVETLFPGTPNEMVSVYHDDQGKLKMTHYCAFGNQPNMGLISSSDNEIKLEFDGNNSIDPATDGHMHSLTIAFHEDGSIVHNWTMYQEGKASGTTVIQLTRAVE